MAGNELAQNEARWYFYKETSGIWRWDLVAVDGTTITQSETPFESRAACIEHARAHGYGSAGDVIIVNVSEVAPVHC
jgi:uncharacterized protein YegP (UPF0339 family)